ncbi:IS630 family transposase [Rhizophagus irregularis DAOM 181602=DAOM 197198]|nr:IS630 family transposase [Rhizophagus irregularis DAOM 181602=DAOM 197198]
MVKTKELSNFERGRIIGLHEAGDSEKTISRKTGYEKTTIHNIITKYHKTAEKMQKEFIESTGKEVSKSTVKRTLYEMGYHSRAALSKPLISESNRLIRLSWACERRSWTINDWKKVVWSDESRFTLFQSDKKIHVWCLPKESHDVSCLVLTIKHGGGDNAPIHTNLKIRTFMEDVMITQLPWPGQSPDLNPIEHMWDELECCIRTRTNSSKNLEELELLLQECWSQIQREVYQKLGESMNHRVIAIIKARGYLTRY